MTKYKIGDKVTIKSNLKKDNFYPMEHDPHGETIVNKSMLALAGKEVVIESIREDCKGYNLVGNCWNWTDSMFEDYSKNTDSRLILTRNFLANLGISKVVYNEKNVVVILKDGTKGIATCDVQDTFDEEVGFAIAYMNAKSGISKKKYKEAIDYISKRKLKGDKAKRPVIFTI